MKKFRKLAGSVLATALAVSTVVSCTTGNGDGLDENGKPITAEKPDGTPDGNPDQPNTSTAFKKIQDEILTPQCATSGCHGASPQLGLSLVDGNSYKRMVGKMSNQVSGLQIVEASNPDASYLIHKLDGSASGGAQMPLGKPPLKEEQIQLIKDWIAAGALEASSGGGGEITATLTSIQSNIFDLNCIECHVGDNPAGALNLETGNSHSQLVSRPLRYDPDGSILVVKGDAASSLLINKLTGEGLGDESDSNYKGQQMPLNAPHLDEASIQTIKDWINAGALDN